MGRESKYSEVYKREAVAKARASGNVSQTARELGISNKSLHTWIKQYGEPRVSLDLDANRIILLDRVTTNEPETEQIPF